MHKTKKRVTRLNIIKRVKEMSKNLNPVQFDHFSKKKKSKNLKTFTKQESKKKSERKKQINKFKERRRLKGGFK